MGVLYINGQKIDTREDINFPITYAIADLKEPNKRARNRTKTIKLPDTPTNRRFFSSTYQITLSDKDNKGIGFDFNHNLKYPASYVSNGVVIFQGVCNLLSATLTDGVLEIEVNLFSDIINMFDTWGDLKVSELGWSEYDHTLNKTNIEDSWTNLNTDGYVYALAYYGYNTSMLQYKTSDLVPYVFKAEILKKALAFLGLTLDSDTLTEANFLKQMWGFGGGDKVAITPAEVAERYVYIDSDTANTGVNFPITLLDDNGTTRTSGFTNTLQNKLQANNINLATINNNVLNQANLYAGDWDGSWTVANKGTYRLSFEGQTTLTGAWSYGNPSGLSYPADLNFYWIFSIYKNGFVIAKQQFESLNQLSNVSDVQTVDISVDANLQAGDVIEFGYEFRTYSTIETNNLSEWTLFQQKMEMDFLPTSVFDFKMESIDEGLVDGDNVSIARYMPDVKVSDFFLDLITTYNLYVDEPRDNVIKIESFNNYYTGEYDEWTDKIDLSRPIKFEPPKLLGKDYIWRFAEDRDFFKQDYYTEFEQDYGDYKLTIEGAYKKGQRVWQTNYAQTVPVEVSPNLVTGSLIIPIIAKSDNGGATFLPYKGKARVFYYNGLKTCYPWTFQDSDGLNPTTKTSYPQFHHLDNVTTPTFDFNFGKPNKVYYTASAYTLNNIIQKQYYSFLQSVLSKEAKVMTAYFNINESDLYNNFMQKLASVDCVRFIKNLVTDYDDNSLEPTMVELFKYVDARSPNTTVDTPVSTSGFVIPQIYNEGVGVSNNTESAQALSASSTTQLVNNASTIEDSYMPNGVGRIYDSATNTFDFSNIAVGSLVNLTIFINASAVLETELSAVFLIDDGGEDEKEIPFTLSSNTAQSSKTITMQCSIVVDEVIKDNSSKIMISNTTACNVQATSYQYIIKAIGTWKK